MGCYAYTQAPMLAKGHTILFIMNWFIYACLFGLQMLSASALAIPDSPGYGNLMLYDSALSKRSTVLAPLEIKRAGWTATADSSQSGNPPSNAIDGDPATFWHTQYNPTLASLPHNLTIDMGNSEFVTGMTYLPRQDGNLNGNVGNHSIFLSNDGTTWGKPVATGTYANDATLKTTYFTPTYARYLLLVIYQDAQMDKNQWASAGEINILQPPRPYVSRTSWTVSADSSETGVTSNTPQFAIDGAGSTLWHTQYTGASPGFPHTFTIDQGASVSIAGLSYLPRPPSSANGRIGSYAIQYSSGGSSWTTATSGTWADNADLKVVEFPSVTARYWRLVANSEAGNRGPWTSAAEINLLDGNTRPMDFIITTDSEEVVAANNTGAKANDNDNSSFWHTAYSASNDPLPHTYTIDMRTSFDVYGLTYLPRQDGGSNGNIGAYKVDISSDMNTWTTVSSGTFLDSSDPKTLNFGENTARYVRLTALTEAGNRGPWSSAAEITPMFSTSSSATVAALGRWGPMIDFPLVPVAAALLPSGKVLLWSAYQPLQFSGTDSKTTQTAYYNPADGTVSQRTVTNTNHDMFCPGLSVDFQGRMTVTGGNTDSATSIYDPVKDTWIQATQLKIGRGYQASVTLSDGRTWTIGGSWSGGTSKKPAEIYDPAANTWTLLSGCPVDPMLTNDAAGLYRQDNHAWLFGWKNASIFQAGPSKAMNWFFPSGQGSYAGAGPRGDDNDAMNGNAVMYDAVNGKIFTAGGAPSYQNNLATNVGHIITIGAPNATVSVIPTSNKMSYARSFHNSVVLPDGSVIVIGGQSYAQPFSDDTSIFYPELWSPKTNSFSVLAPMRVPRVYHSIALLLPDATILSGGGGLCGTCDTNHPNAQVYYPPYLFASNGSPASRPVINSISTTTVKVGASFQVTTSGGASQFSMIRMGSATHSVDTDQRRISLTQLTQSGTSGSYTIAIPSDPGIVIPGYWMVFALTSGGVPSIAKIIQVTL